MKILIIGNRDATNIGGSLERAGLELGMELHLIESRLAMQAAWPVKKFNWYFRGHRPAKLKEFGIKMIESALSIKPDWLLSVGMSPIERPALAELKELKIKRVVYLTDDPWNPVHRSTWFLNALPLYSHVFTPRKSIIDDLKNIGCDSVHYLPFGYDPALFYPEKTLLSENRKNYEFDILFAGSADRDRARYIEAIIKAGFNLGLYGSFWQRFGKMNRLSRGQADFQTMRMAISNSKVVLCLVRRANRDGNSMRTFEIPAIGACMLTEDTEEHRKIFGNEGEAVVYFKSTDEMIKKAEFLLANETERHRLAEKCHNLITGGGNTYKDRLLTMLKTCGD
jgi:spore maturation protein CgeB